MIDFLRRIFLVDLLKGLWVTLKYTPQPAFTFQYPAERRPVAPRFRALGTRLRVSPSGAEVGLTDAARAVLEVQPGDEVGYVAL